MKKVLILFTVFCITWIMLTDVVFVLLNESNTFENWLGVIILVAYATGLYYLYERFNSYFLK